MVELIKSERVRSGPNLRVLVLKMSWYSRLPTLRLNDRKWGLALVVKRSGKAGALFYRDRFEATPQVSK